MQELQELPTSPLRMWPSSKKHQLPLTWAPGLGVEPGSRGYEADALPLRYPHIPSKMSNYVVNMKTKKLQIIDNVGAEVVE